MASALALRDDFTAARMRALARSSRDANQARRLLALATIYERGTRGDSAHLGGVGLQTVRDWGLRFNCASPAGLVDASPPGGVTLLDDVQRQALAQIVESGPIPASHGVVRWRSIDLAQWVWDEFAIRISKQTLSRELRAMGYPRPLLLRLEPPRRSTVAHHVDRAAPLGTWVIVSETWYYTNLRCG